MEFNFLELQTITPKILVMGTAICIIILDYTFNSYAYNTLPTVIQLTNT